MGQNNKNLLSKKKQQFTSKLCPGGDWTIEMSVEVV